MNMEQLLRISVIDPIGPAIEKVKTILFKPFDLRKWFVIGFCAWLAYLGSGVGAGSSWGRGPPYNVSYKQEKDAQISEAFEEALNAAKEHILGNLNWIIPAVVFVGVLIIGICFLITWLSSRGRFMFIHCISGNKAEIVVPWRKFKKQANSLFWFRIVLRIIGFVVVCLPVAGIILLIIMMATRIGPNVASIFGIIILVLLIFVLSVALFLVKKFTMDFVVPIMFLRTASSIAGWREFMTILSANKLRFALYLLFQIVIAIVIGTIAAIVTFIVSILSCCCTCGIMFCFMIIPPFSIGFGYILTVVLLPLFSFKRAYSLCYLRQFGSEFDVFSPEIEPA